MLYVPGFLKTLIAPPASLFILGAAGWIARRRWKRTGSVLIGSSIVLLLLLSTPVCTGWLLRTLQSAPALTPASFVDDAGAIVVLGAELYADAPEFGKDTVGIMTLQRLRYGAWLHRATGVPLLTSGGVTREGHAALGTLMAESLREEFQVPVRWVEAESRNTFDNAKRSAAILQRAGVTRAYLVTSAYHMPRAKAAFEAAGLRVVPAPTGVYRPRKLRLTDFLPRAGALAASALVFHEWLGRVWYEVAYY